MPEYNKAPVAFGVEKLVMGCIVFDDILSTDELTEKIESLQGTYEDEDEDGNKETVEGFIV